MMERIHLLIADDHPMVRDDLRDLLSSQSDFEVVGEATNGLEATELTTKLRPDVVLMDLFMPAMDGAAATARIKAMHPDVHVLVVSIDPRDAAIRRALEAGASSYLLKDAPRQELYRAIRDAARGKLLPAPAVAAPTANRRRDPAGEPLSERESPAHEPEANGATDKGVPADSPPDSSPPKTLEPRSDERYSLTKLIGSGGMAEVYLARDQELGRDVAFKVLRNQYADDRQLVERFGREARNAALLTHPNIVAIHDRGKTKDGAYYMVMEYVSGGNLKERILRQGPLSPPEAIAIALQVAQALQVAHEWGIVHRDVKPQNILLTESGGAKITDFGIARAASAAQITQEGAILGSAHYLSPEQALGQPANIRSDLYSLGTVLYEMLTGVPPHDAETPFGIVMKHVSGQLRPPREANPKVPDEIDAVTVRLLARDPEERYQDTAEVIEDLRRAQRGEYPAFVTIQQDTADSVIALAGPSAGTSSGGRPQTQEQKPGTSPASPPTPSVGGSNNETRSHRVLPLDTRTLFWALAIVLVAAMMLLVVGPILVK